MNTSKVCFFYLILLLPITIFAQRNLGNFSFGTLHQVHSQFTAKENKMFVVIFTVIPSKNNQILESFQLTFPKEAQLEEQNTSIEKSGEKLLLIAEVKRLKKQPIKRIEKVNATLTTTVRGIANNQPTIQNTDIPFSFDLRYR